MRGRSLSCCPVRYQLMFPGDTDVCACFAFFLSVPQSEEVEEGQQKSVLLSFKTTANLPRDVTVQWTRSDSNMEVHVFESGNNQPDEQDQGYRGRTEMNEDPLRTGDLSLTLKPLHLTDRGVYTCTVYNKDGKKLLQKVVTLRVKGECNSCLSTAKIQHENNRSECNSCLSTVTENRMKSCWLHSRGDDGGSTSLMSVSLFFAFFFSVPHTEVVGLTQEKESVDLPFKTTADLPHDVTVEWTDPKHRMVHVYESGKDQPDKQNPGYRGRTEMKEDPLRTKDLSLTLKYPIVMDSGVYTCTVYNKDGDMLQKAVTLSVTGECNSCLSTVGISDLVTQQRTGWSINLTHVCLCSCSPLSSMDGDSGGDTKGGVCAAALSNPT
uniref:Ig-like domain-containing protein n=1 Tax=Maylandia zebra TaxID=106582 RepID=A0A3P9BS19_9CICH